jgi:hypothetical protein
VNYKKGETYLHGTVSDKLSFIYDSSDDVKSVPSSTPMRILGAVRYKVKVKVKQSNYRTGQALRVPRG